MDTGTHLVIGLGLAGLAHIDPVVAADPHTAAAVMAGTVLGSQAPDLDGLLRFRGNAVYIRNHRGTSHSLPALFLWGILITALVSLIFGELPLLHLALWTFGAVCFHVFTDLFNTYGTQAAKPFTEKWISWNIIHIFDPFIFFSHLAAIFLWAVKFGRPEVIFPVLYGLIALYYIWRSVHHYLLEKRIARLDTDFHPEDKIFAIPTVNLNVWNVVKRRHDGTYVIGDYRNEKLRWIDRVSCHSHPAIDASRRHPDVAAFLYFSSFACAEVRELENGYEVRWADVRYRHRKQYPFVAVLRMDRDYTPLYSYVGWKSESRIEKKLSADTI
ncbi:metal-dependent hydrolase [Paenibacillus aurantius]|uniref:Metal-dependent hydrolase n=1 Tax=Paenibacillus aurantius TaxID=2918900 RepID=A0AA96RG19_9BACL|nr:metal-dependent hydrolase [Paenibacillus aurantius]WJH32222.1 metal-dependent hydrolase [Paenibacillus sp. CC-CFT747]WNQ12597.1 metal-dependent hydrolase [Paenibacillus aurantius]